VSGGGERALDLRRGYATSFPPNQVNESKKGSNGPAGSRSGKETLDRRRGYVTSFPPNQVNDSEGGHNQTHISFPTQERHRWSVSPTYSPGTGFKTLSFFSPVSGGPPERPVALTCVAQTGVVAWRRRTGYGSTRRASLEPGVSPAPHRVCKACHRAAPWTPPSWTLFPKKGGEIIRNRRLHC